MLLQELANDVKRIQPVLGGLTPQRDNPVQNMTHYAIHVELDQAKPRTDGAENERTDGAGAEETLLLLEHEVVLLGEGRLTPGYHYLLAAIVDDELRHLGDEVPVVAHDQVKELTATGAAEHLVVLQKLKRTHAHWVVLGHHLSILGM